MQHSILKFTRRENWHWRVLFSAVIGLWCLITVILFANVLKLSFEPEIAIFQYPWSLPQHVTFQNYVNMFNDGFLNFFANSFYVLLISIVLLLAVSAPAAYGLGKFAFRGNKLLRLFFLIGMMFPVQLGIIPLFNLMRTLHLMNTRESIILIYAASVSLPIFILTNFVQSVPDALREAAKIDGASEFQIFYKIFLPLMSPALGALLPLSAVGIWNDFFIPLVFITNDALKTVPLGLMQYFTNRGFDLSKVGIEFAAMSLSIFPLLLLYIFGSRYIIGGLTTGAVK